MQKKYAAVIEMTSWLGTHQHIVRGNTLSDLIEDLENVQSLRCLIRMGRGCENKAGQKQLDTLEYIVERSWDGELTMEDLQRLDVELSVGTIKFLELFEGEESQQTLPEKYPQAN